MKKQQDAPVHHVSAAAWAELRRRPELIVASIAATAIGISLFFVVTDPRFGFFALVLYWLLLIGHLMGKARSKLIQQFAQAHGYSYVGDQALHHFEGSVLAARDGHSRRSSDMVVGSLGETPFKLFQFEYTIGHSKHSQIHQHSVMHLATKSRLPHLIIDSKQFNTIKFDYHNSQLLQLEGDFNRYFRIYGPKKYEMEVLQILTPDVMAQLIDKSNLFDVELINNSVYIYSKEYIDTREKLEALHELATTLIAELGNKLHNFRLTDIHPTVLPTLKRGFDMRYVLVIVGGMAIVLFAHLMFNVWLQPY
jgi:hypothetical protein